MFAPQELDVQLRHLKTGKAPGPDDIHAEHLQHLGPDTDPEVRAAGAAARLSQATLPRGIVELYWLSCARCLTVLDTGLANERHSARGEGRGPLL